MIEGARPELDVLVFLAERKTEHDFARGRQASLSDQRFHLVDMVAIGALDSQVRPQIVRQAVTAVAGNGRIAMRFGIAECTEHPLGSGKVEEILRHIRSPEDGATKELSRLLL